jgi:hypothetical protein
MSNTAIRSSSGTKLALFSSVTDSTKETMEAIAGESAFQYGIVSELFEPQAVSDSRMMQRRSATIILFKATPP